MIGIKQTILTILFSSLCVGVFFYSNIGDWEHAGTKDRNRDSKNKQSVEISEMLGVDIYSLKNKLPHIYLKAETLFLNTAESIISGETILGHSYNQKRDPIYYHADNGKFLQKSEELHLDGKVVVNTDESQVKSDKMSYYMKADKIESIGNVESRKISKLNGDKIYINSDKVISYPSQNKFHYKDKVKGKISRKRVYEETVYFKSNNLFLDGTERKITLNGDVFFKKENMRATGHRGEIFLDNYNKKVKYFALYQDVKMYDLVKLSRGVVERRAYAEKVEGILSEKKILLSGYPKVYQGKDVIRGNLIILRENNEVVEVFDANTDFILKKR